MSKNRGFTLIEVMVVLVIIDILVTAVSLSLKGDRAGEALDEEAQRLSALLNLAREEAVMRDSDIGLALAQDGYLFAQRDEGNEAADAEEVFIPLNDDPMFRPRSLPSGTELRFEVQQNNKTAQRSSRSAARNTPSAPPASGRSGVDTVQPSVLVLANDMFQPQGTLLLSHPATPRVVRIVIEQDGARVLPEQAAP